MTYPFVDTSVIIRLLTRDDEAKELRARNLFEQVEAGILIVSAPDTVIADAVFVLSSRRLYNRPRDEIAALLTPLVRLPGFHVENRRAVLSALDIYGKSAHLDFGHALIIAQMQQAGSQTLYAYDTDFDRVAGITRQEP